MNTPKITKKDYYNAIIAMAQGKNFTLDADKIVTFCEKEINTLTVRAEKAKARAAEKRAEGDELQAAVLAVLTDEPATRQEVTDRLDGDDITLAKVGYRLTALTKTGFAVKEEIIVTDENGKTKKMAAYRLA